MSQSRSKELQTILHVHEELLEKARELVNMREERVKMTSGYVEKFSIFLEKRDAIEVETAKIYIQNVLKSDELPTWCNTGFRALLHAALKARIDVSPTIQFKDFELFAVWGLLILELELGDLKKIIRSNEFDNHLHTVEAQLSETLQLTIKLSGYSFFLDAAAYKVDELTSFGSSIGLSGNSRAAAKAMQKPRRDLEQEVILLYSAGLKGHPFNSEEEPPWQGPADAGRRIYKKLEEPKKNENRTLSSSNGAKTMTKWIWAWIRAQEKVSQPAV